MKSGKTYNVLILFGFSLLFYLFEPWTTQTVSADEISVPESLVMNNCTLEGVSYDVIARGDTDPTELHIKFELPDLPFIWEPAEPGEPLAQFHKSLRVRLGPDIDSRQLTQRQRDIFVTLPDSWSDEAINSALLLDGHAGEITEMSCLEILLWEWQDARFSMLEHPTEFSAFVLKRHGHVRVYLSSADLVGSRVNREVTERIQADVLEGFRLFTHIHNHPFLFDRETGDRMWTTEDNIADIAGALAPSMSDVGAYRNFHDSLGLEEAWITNGIQSSRFHSSEFSLLRAR